MAYSEEALAFSTIPTKDQVRLEDRVSYLSWSIVRFGRIVRVLLHVNVGIIPVIPLSGSVSNFRWLGWGC